MNKLICRDMRDDELQHHGILGQKWGVRRWQNEDGTYTPAGKLRYGKGSDVSKNVREAAAAGMSYRQISKALSKSDVVYPYAKSAANISAKSRLLTSPVVGSVKAYKASKSYAEQILAKHKDDIVNIRGVDRRVADAVAWAIERRSTLVVAKPFGDVIPYDDPYKRKK